MHQPADMQLWRGRDDTADGDNAVRWHQRMRPVSADAHNGIALLGFASDAGVERNHGRPGARQGPAALRKMLTNMPAHRVQALYDAGDVRCDGDALETAQDLYATRMAALLDQGLLPLGLGGGHEIAWASFSGLARHLDKAGAADATPRVGIINFDAHFDLRMAERANSGTPFRQIAEDCGVRGWPFRYLCFGISRFANTAALFDRARTFGAQWQLDEDMHFANLAASRALLAGFLGEVDHVYFTICLDVLPAAVAPGVSAPAARGVGLEVLEPLIDDIAASGKLRIADMAELNPGCDIDQRTARVGARLLARLAEGVQ